MVFSDPECHDHSECDFGHGSEDLRVLEVGEVGIEWSCKKLFLELHFATFLTPTASNWTEHGVARSEYSSARNSGHACNTLTCLQMGMAKPSRLLKRSQ
jgi:hypothetical protein